MGIAKAQMIDAMARGFRPKYGVSVCVNCFDEPGIRELITGRSDSSICSYCDPEKKHPACSFNDVMEHIVSSLNQYWTDPGNAGLYYESAEGGWQGHEILNSYELFLNYIDLGVDNGELLDDICTALVNNDWVPCDPYSLRDNEVMIIGWDNFCRFVKNTARYFFLNTKNKNYDPDQHDEIDPIQILDILGDLIKKQNLITTIDPGTEVRRVRITKINESLETARDLGSPPTKFANLPNRMSPAGISMFYGAFDIETAIQETYKPCNEDKKAICGIFTPVRPLIMIDLSRNITIPTIFQKWSPRSRHDLQFLNDFLTDFTKPIDRENSAHIDYVPTQIVTEYFRHIFEISDGVRADGVIYPSSKEGGNQAMVIFADSQACDKPKYHSSSAQLLTLINIESRNLLATANA